MDGERPYIRGRRKSEGRPQRRAGRLRAYAASLGRNSSCQLSGKEAGLSVTWNTERGLRGWSSTQFWKSLNRRVREGAPPRTQSECATSTRIAVHGRIRAGSE